MADAEAGGERSRERILVINGALGGVEGNTAAVLDTIVPTLSQRADVAVLTLSERPELDVVLKQIRRADGFVFATGVYWDSWGSPLQHFLEDVSSSEGTEVWLGKPAAIVVSMHSVGGKAVVSRLMGVLNTFGVWVPPFSAMVYSLVNQIAVASRPDESIIGDLWTDDDLEVVCHNLLTALSGGQAWRTWRVDRLDPRRRWMPWPSSPAT